jgi:hypothetical protein
MDELDRYERDLERLAGYEQSAEDDLAMVEGLDHWQPTAYEQLYLPGVRLAGIPDNAHVTLQNVADLHIHTHYSDGDKLEDVLEFAATARLDAIAITDHDAIECTNAVPGYGRKYNIEAYEELASRNVRIGMTGSSDAHSARMIGKGKTYYAGNEGLLSAKTAIEYGFVQGAESYWRFSEKLRYRISLFKVIAKRLLKRNGGIPSVN